MGKVDVTFNGAALASQLVAASSRDLRVRANRVLNVARAKCPVDEGRLRASIHVEFGTGKGGSPVARIGSNLPYAIFVHEGTGIYGPKGAMIRARKGRFMVWPRVNNSGVGRRQFKGGATEKFVFAKQTRGSPGRPFLTDALRAAG